MQELSFEQVEDVSGGSRGRMFLDIIEAAGAAEFVNDCIQAGISGGAYFYENVMIYNNWIDDVNFMQP